MKNSNREALAAALDRVKELCLCGEMAAAVSAVTELLRGNPQEPRVLHEAVKTYLLSGYAEQALELARHLPVEPHSGESGYLLRLRLLGVDVPVPDTHAPQWWRDYEASGTDPLHDTEFEDMSVRCDDGTIHYTFGCRCPACGSSYAMTIGMTFLVRREYYCPHCFARLLIDFSLIKRFMERCRLPGRNRRREAIDVQLRRLQFDLDRDAVAGERYPLICRNLGQDFVFFMNHLLVNRIISE